MGQIKFGLHFNHNSPIVHTPNRALETEPVSEHEKTITSPSQQPIKRALLIGINYYGTENQLEGCINDVHNIKELIIKSFHFSPEHITLMKDDPKEDIVLKPTRNSIISHLKNIVAKSNTGDELFIHYSGHGTQLYAEDGSEDQNIDTPGMEDAICPCDFDRYNNTDGFISDATLRKIICESLKPGVKLRTFFDCCHSGSVLNLPFMFSPIKGDDFITVDPELALGNQNCLCISGCKDSQTSADAFINKTYSGALTWALLTTFNGLKAEMNWKDFLLAVRDALAQNGYEQIPVLTVGDKNLEKVVIDL